MNLKICKVIVAFLMLHITLAIPIETPIETTIETPIETLIGAPFKCGDLECPNGSICEITQKPNEDCKSATIHTQCKTVAGQLLKEETIKKDLPEGKIPITSFIQKTFSGHGYGAYTKDLPHSNDGAHPGEDSYSEGEPSISFVSLDDAAGSEPHDESHDGAHEPDFFDVMPFDFDAIGSLFDKIWSVPTGFLHCTTSFFDDVFNNFFPRSLRLNSIFA